MGTNCLNNNTHDQERCIVLSKLIVSEVFVSPRQNEAYILCPSLRTKKTFSIYRDSTIYNVNLLKFSLCWPLSLS